MDLAFNVDEGRVLHGLLEETSGDIVIKLDANGFIVHASSNIIELGADLTAQLIMPHIRDLCEDDHSDLVADYAQQILTGYAPNSQSGDSAVEFPVLVHEDQASPVPTASRRWYSLSLKPMFSDELLNHLSPGSTAYQQGHSAPPCARVAPSGEITGAVGLLRSVHHRRLLEGELYSRAVTDPLTGLSNRHAFCANMRRHLAKGASRVVVVFAVDRMRAMFLQYGQRTADEVLWGFAKFLEAMAQPDYELAQLDNERFAIMLPDMSIALAREWAQEVLDTFSSLTITSSARAPQLSASAGLAQLESTVDWTLRQAELALVIARAGGGMQVAQCDYQSPAPRRTQAG